MKRRWTIGGLLLIYGLAFAANVGHFWWNYYVGWLQSIASAVYIVTWICFLVLGRREKWRWSVSVWVSALTAVSGIVGFLARTFGEGILTILGVLTAGITVTPLYGIFGLISDYDVFYVAIAVLGAVWLSVSLGMKRKLMISEPPAGACDSGQ